MAPHNVVVIYKEWVNSVLCEEGIEIRSISQLATQNLLLRLYQTLTLEKDEADLKFYDGIIQTSEVESVGTLLRLLRADGVRTNLQPSDITNGDFQAILELVWLLLLNYGIHRRGESASQQRTTSIGTKLLLRWCSELLGGACFDYRLSMTENMEKDVLHNIINQVTNLVSKPDEPEPCDYHEAIADAERKLGVSSNLLRAYDTQTENLAVTVYISLLRRKRELILSGRPPTRPTVLVNQQPQAIPERPHSNLSMHNDKTQKMLKDIQKQLDVYQNGPTASLNQHSEGNIYSDQSLKESSRHQSPASSIQSRVPSTDSSGTILSSIMPSPIDRAHGSFPNETNDSLRIDLSALQQSDRKSCSTTTTPRKNADGIAQQTAEFTALLRQLREEVAGQRDESDELPAKIVDTTHSEKYKDEEDDRTSPKSAPNTDEGFGTFTKTTPRGKDSASEGSDDHTDCDVDHLTTPEPGSITEWWDRIEMPSVEVTAVDASLFKSASKEQSLPRLDEDGRLEMADDELMCMIDSIGMTGIKASSGLASAQETELRLLYILKERDDLVLSYHGALKELSKLTARMKDENHLLRQRLNMTDLSHSEIVLALEEQASDGRKLALGLQDDLTDTEVNILSRLREDKQVLQDRLAALEQQYEEDVQKWQKAGTEEEGVTRRENAMLRLQLEEQRRLFDVTVSQAQDECSSYLVTIDRLKAELSNNVSPLSDAQLDALAKRQADMEKLYESMVGSLEGDNERLQAELEQLRGEVTCLKAVKENRDKNSGTANQVADSGGSADCMELQNRSANTSFSESARSSEARSAQQAVKSIGTDTDEALVSLQQQVLELEEVVAQGSADQESLQQQKSDLLDNHKQLSEKLGNVESQLQMTRQKLTTLQAVHELALSKNESLARALSDSSSQLTTEITSKEQLQQQLSTQLVKASDDSAKLSSEVTFTRQQLVALQAECAAFRQREVDMTAELTKLTQERSNLQSKVNSLNSDLVNQKAQHVSQSMKVQQLEAAKGNMESQVADFKRESVGLFEKLEAARQEKDDLSQQLSSLHTKLSESMSDWKRQLATQSEQHQQMISNKDSEMSAARSTMELYKSETDRLTSELGSLRKQLKDAQDVSAKVTAELSGLLKTAKVDERADDAIGQLHDQLKALQKETAEYKFTTTHFRSENGQLQLRVNQLEEMNRSIEERNKILQADLTAVQTSLDDSYTSADAQLNLLDMSAADIMSISDASQLRDYILAAKRQVEMMQSKRAKSNIEYSRKIFEMEKLMKDKRGDSSEAPSYAATMSIKSTIDSTSAATDYVGLPESFTLNNSSALAASLHHEKDHSSGDLHLTHYQKSDNLSQVLEPVPSTTLHSYRTHQSHSTSDSVKKHPVTTVEANYRLHKVTPTGNSTGYLNDTPQQVPLAGSASHSQPLKLRYIPSSSLHEKVHNRQSTSPPFASEQAHRLPLDSQLLPADISDIDLASSQDSLALKVNSLTNRPGTSTPTQTHSPGTKHRNGSEVVKMSTIESENAALKAELDILNTDRNSLHKQMKRQTVQHDVLNDTLDELERSLEEVCDSNRLLRDTLGDCNDYIQSNILSEPPSSPRSSRNFSTSGMSGRPRPHSTAPGSRAHPVTPAGRSRSMTPAARPHSVTPSRPYSSTSRLTPHSVTFAATPSTNQDSAGWSTQSDRQMTSSYDFNKLQQTNVHNYSSLLNSEMNSKSPSRRSMTDRKSTDLNHMIQHSLSKLNQVNSTGTSPSLSTGYTSTPLKSSRSSVYSSLPGTTDGTDSEISGPYITANQDAASSVPSATDYRLGLHPIDSRGSYTSFDPLRQRERSNHLELPASWAGNSSLPLRLSGLGSRTTSPYVKVEKSPRMVYNDGGPGPDEPKAVLPEPKQL